MAGQQCPKLLWWTVHEPDAPELQSDSPSVLLERGQRIGERARAEFPDAVIIDVPRYDLSKRVAASEAALAQGARVVCEASFFAGGVFVSIDVLERKRGGFVVTEVKSTKSVKLDHITDVGLQVHVARDAGLNIKRAEVMHLNPKCRHPDLSDLFVRKNVTPQVNALAPMAKAIRRQLKVLAGPTPSVPPGAHCTRPYVCPFIARCSPPLPTHHVSTLHGIRAKKADQLIADGFETLLDLPDDYQAKGVADRQIRSARTGRIVVDDGLREVLAELEGPIAFLDFETVSPAIPAWPGCGPYDQVPVQLSCHTVGDGPIRHYEWLAEGGGDPREAFALALLAACSGAKTIVAYNAPFERGCIERLIAVVPRLAKTLGTVIDRLCDLLPIVRDHIYHPAFEGSFSIKKVLPALVPDLGYSDLAIADGSTASAMLESVLLHPASMTASERTKARAELLLYCARDTLAMVRLHTRLAALADP